MKEIILIVTWFFGGVSPSSYTVSFTSPAACEAARIALVGEAKRLDAQQQSDNQAMAQTGAVRPLGGVWPRGPQLSAVCAPR